MSALILFGSLFILIFIGVPVAYCILIAGSLFIIIMKTSPMILVVQRMIRGMDSFAFLAIPLFIYAGYIMGESGMSRRLTDFVKAFTGNMRGNMGVITFISCAIFASLTGSGPATVATIGIIMVPAMIESGYTKSRACGIVASGGALGPIIPPSIPMIIYGSTLGVSIPKMFIGGIIPGIIIALIFIIINQLFVNRWGVKSVDRVYTIREKLKYTVDAIGTLLLPVIILGGIYGGIFTPTEAASIAVIFSIIVGFFYKVLNFKKLIEITKTTAIISSTVMFILAAGNLFTFLMASSGIPKKISLALIPILKSQNIYLLVLSLILFTAGTLFDASVSILLIGPVIVPLGIQLGIDPVHLGIVFCVNLCLGYITPPYGTNLFTASTVLNESFLNITKNVFPFLITAMIFSVLLMFMPWLTLFLPNLM